MRKKGTEPVDIAYFTDPLCPRSWAMEPMIASLRSEEGVRVRSVFTGWLPSVASRSVESSKREWADAGGLTKARIDVGYWDRVGPKTSLLASAAVKAAVLQGAAKGETYLSAVRQEAFERDSDVSDPKVLIKLAQSSGLREDLFRTDLGVGRYTVDQILQAVGSATPLSEALWWFGRRTMLRSWDALAEDLRLTEERRLSSPAFRLSRGTKDATLAGFVTPAKMRTALESVR